ncbi:hypothetical protein GJ496_001769 [Pomphorhynchus laevis]|nr:hypothetical protein GJ496_001769 [Pomphorhynchus laevis]
MLSLNAINLRTLISNDMNVSRSAASTDITDNNSCSTDNTSQRLLLPPSQVHSARKIQNHMNPSNVHSISVAKFNVQTVKHKYIDKIENKGHTKNHRKSAIIKPDASTTNSVINDVASAVTTITDASTTDTTNTITTTPVAAAVVSTAGESPDSLRQAHRTCSCTRSMCLKLYCECFTNGRFCLDCHCTNCHNSLDFEEERNKSIRLILQRNPNAFKSKIDIGSSVNAQSPLLNLHDHNINVDISSRKRRQRSSAILDSLLTNKLSKMNDINTLQRSPHRTKMPLSAQHLMLYNPASSLHTEIVDSAHGHHVKGCNCRKSSCLKKYCECYEAQIPCTSLCKCVNCKNMYTAYIPNSIDKDKTISSLSSDQPHRHSVGLVDEADHCDGRLFDNNDYFNSISDQHRLAEHHTPCHQSTTTPDEFMHIMVEMKHPPETSNAFVSRPSSHDSDDANRNNDFNADTSINQNIDDDSSSGVQLPSSFLSRYRIGRRSSNSSVFLINNPCKNVTTTDVSDGISSESLPLERHTSSLGLTGVVIPNDIMTSFANEPYLFAASNNRNTTDFYKIKRNLQNTVQIYNNDDIKCYLSAKGNFALDLSTTTAVTNRASMLSASLDAGVNSGGHKNSGITNRYDRNCGLTNQISGLSSSSSNALLKSKNVKLISDRCQHLLDSQCYGDAIEYIMEDQLDKSSYTYNTLITLSSVFSASTISSVYRSSSLNYRRDLNNITASTVKLMMKSSTKSLTKYPRLLDELLSSSVLTARRKTNTAATTDKSDNESSSRLNNKSNIRIYNSPNQDSCSRKQSLRPRKQSQKSVKDNSVSSTANLISWPLQATHQIQQQADQQPELYNIKQLSLSEKTTATDIPRISRHQHRKSTATGCIATNNTITRSSSKLRISVASLSTNHRHHHYGEIAASQNELNAFRFANRDILQAVLKCVVARSLCWLTHHSQKDSNNHNQSHHDNNTTSCKSDIKKERISVIQNQKHQYPLFKRFRRCSVLSRSLSTESSGLTKNAPSNPSNDNVLQSRRNCSSFDPEDKETLNETVKNSLQSLNHISATIARSSRSFVVSAAKANNQPLQSLPISSLLRTPLCSSSNHLATNVDISCPNDSCRSTTTATAKETALNFTTTTASKDVDTKSNSALHCDYSLTELDLLSKSKFEDDNEEDYHADEDGNKDTNKLKTVMLSEFSNCMYQIIRNDCSVSSFNLRSNELCRRNKRNNRAEENEVVDESADTNEIASRRSALRNYRAVNHRNGSNSNVKADELPLIDDDHVLRTSAMTTPFTKPFDDVSCDHVTESQLPLLDMFNDHRCRKQFSTMTLKTTLSSPSYSNSKSKHKDEQ